MSELFGQSQLDAGGFVALDAKCDMKATESMIARTYGAPVLGDRVVVRLTSDRLVPAEDLSMEFLGLEGRSVSQPIARQNRTALEFGHWALIHQPKHAKYALDLVKRMKGAARKAASKAGHAWDLYTEMAEELNKSVRHFLPAFWEQAARAYKDLGNPTYAGRALNKALEAERVHSLKVDREHRRDAVLEFTLGGCLSGKALTEYSKDLEKQFKPDEAYETFKDLVIRRTAGGLPPVANVASDLSRLAKLAKLNVDHEIESMLEAIITSPAMARAPMQFWKSVKKHVARVVARNPSFAVWLLVHTNPTPSYSSDSAIWDWIELLEEWKVTPYLSMPAESMPHDVELPGGRVGWFGRIAFVESSPPKKIFELAEQMADVMRLEGQPIKLESKCYYSRIDVDVLETLLDLGLEVSHPTGQMQLDFSGWFREAIDHPRRNSQLERVLNDPRFEPQVREQIPELVKFPGSRLKQSWGRTLAPQRSFEEAAAGHPHVRLAWWKYLEEQLVALEQGGLVDFEEAVSNLRSCVGAATLTEFPELESRLKAIDAGASLHRTLVAGVFDEYGWEALDAADDAATLPTSSRYGDEKHFWCFPNLAVFDGTSIRVVSPAGVSKPFDFVIAKSKQLQNILPLGDCLAIVYRDSSEGWKSYLIWSNRPSETHLLSDTYFSPPQADAVVPIPKLGFFFGDRAVQIGDKVLPGDSEKWLHDGERFWKIENYFSHMFGYRWLLDESNVTPPKVFEIDPESGKVIRNSVPQFFETALPSRSLIDWTHSYLLPAPECAGESPLGSANGLIGMRCILRRDGSTESVGVDGRKWVFESTEQSPKNSLFALAILDKPAKSGHWIITSDNRILDSESRITLGRVSSPAKYFAGTPIPINVRFMHLLRLRCLESSKRLREVDIAAAAKLLAAGSLEHEALKKKEDPNHPDPQRKATFDAVSQLLPKAPRRLLTGVARLARIAAEENAALHSLLQRISPEVVAEKTRAQTATLAFNNEVADQGFSQILLPTTAGLLSYSRPIGLAAQLAEVGEFFRGKVISTLPRVDYFWFSILQDLPGIAWRSFWKLATDDKGTKEIRARLKGPWIDCFKCIAATGLLDLPGKLCLYSSTYTEQDASTASPLAGLMRQECVPFIEGDRRYIAFLFSRYPQQVVFTLGYSPDGKVKPPKAYAIEESQELVAHWKAKDVHDFIKALEKLDTLPLPAPEKLLEAASRLNLNPISVALVWMGELRTNRYGQEKLTKELREHYDWKVKDIQTALAELASIEVPRGLITDCLRDPTFAFSHPKGAFARMVGDWSDLRSSDSQLPPEVASVLGKAISSHALPIKLFTELMTEGEKSEIFLPRKVQVRPDTKANSYQPMEIVYDPPTNWPPNSVYPHLVKALSIVNYFLPTGHPVRQRIPIVIDAIRRFLDDPQTIVPAGGFYQWDSSGSNNDAAIASLSAIVGKLEKDEHGIFRCDTGSLIVASLSPHTFFFIRPSKLRSESDFATVHAAAVQKVAGVTVTGARNDCARFVQQMRSEQISQLADCNRDNRIPSGQWEQNPLVSVPELVVECAKKLKVSEPAATLYLQILTLHDPTTSNIKNWNHWTSKQFQVGAEELVKAGHLIEAKRERAGRDVFLPGGWEPLKLPNLPIESWKLPMFGFHSTDRLRGSSAEMIVCEDSIAGMFATAWGRFQSGDTPVYQDAPIKPKRKK